jgi:hypothetical protein
MPVKSTRRQYRSGAVLPEQVEVGDEGEREHQIHAALPDTW